MQNERQPLGLTKPVQGRALRLIQALITAAETEGHTCSAGQTGFAPPSHRRRRAHPHFTITAQGHPVGFLVLQEQDRAEHVATEKELADAKKHSWVKIPRFDYTPSERLRLTLSGGQPHRASEGQTGVADDSPSFQPGRSSLRQHLARRDRRPPRPTPAQSRPGVAGRARRDLTDRQVGDSWWNAPCQPTCCTLLASLT
ncbi:hypothetical protein AB0C13_39895 [Streptomyces sp. NPDC049099]|uniref:hypothetical protein n=1 Tax=Streptomyces sp. NPDC049099 TaxID=3155768 RepID=UPI0034133FB1